MSIRGIANALINLAPVATTGSYGDLNNCPTIPPMVYRTRVQTNTSGTYTWTFPTQFSNGIIPIVQVTVEDGGAGIFQHKITSISNTSVTIQLAKTTVTTVLGIDVLAISTTPQAYIHIMALSP